VGYLIFCVPGCGFQVGAGIGLAPSQQEKLRLRKLTRDHAIIAPVDFLAFSLW
jgi:hypothetical protein